jgi:hypothetical protein
MIYNFKPKQLPEKIPYIGAHLSRYQVAQPGRPWDLLVIHDMETPETNAIAENIAKWFQREPTPRTSAHYCIDGDSIVQCVQLRDVAYAAPNANRNGIHLELAGRASQTLGQWTDPYSLEVIDRAALLTAKIIIPKTHIPVVFLDHERLRQGRVGLPVRGITTHAAVSRAYGAAGGHTDPGPNFPTSLFLERVMHHVRC